MNISLIRALLLFLTLFSSTAFSLEYPDTLIQAQLQQARQPIEVNLSSMEPGELKSVFYVNRVVWIYRRTKADLAYLNSKQVSHLENPESKGYLQVIEDHYQNSRSEVWARILMLSQPPLEEQPFRSLKADYLVASNSGPVDIRLKMLPAELRPHPSALLLDVGTGAWYDAAGRLLKPDRPMHSASKSAGANLAIPPHYFASPSRLVIGLEPSTEIPHINRQAIRSRAYTRLNPAEKLAIAAGYNDMDEVSRCLRSGTYKQALYESPNPINTAIIGGNRAIIDLLLAHGIRPTWNTHKTAEAMERHDVLEFLNKNFDIPAPHKSGDLILNYNIFWLQPEPEKKQARK